MERVSKVYTFERFSFVYRQFFNDYLRSVIYIDMRVAQFVLQKFKDDLLTYGKQHPENFEDEIGITCPIPHFEESLLIELLEEAKNVFKKQPMVLQIQSPVYVIGDIHGNIQDLVRVLSHTDIPPTSQLLFLGDYVDRGNYSVEVVALLFSLLCCHPEQVFLLRGNHEFENMNSTYGFQNEVYTQYSSRRLFDKFNDCFMWMPLVAIIDTNIFCVHGGICPNLENLDQLERIRRPLYAYDVEYVSDLVWSDPVECVTNYEESTRGLGVQFGTKALRSFLLKLHMKKIFRAHQCVQFGVAVFDSERLYTIFSCSSYESNDNKCGLLFIDIAGTISLYSLPPINPLLRNHASFDECVYVEEIDAENSLAMNIKLADVAYNIGRRSASKMPTSGKGKKSLLQRSLQNIQSRGLASKAPAMSVPTLLPPLRE